MSKEDARLVLADMEAAGFHPYINTYGSIVHQQHVPIDLFRKAIDCGHAMFEVIQERENGKSK